MTVEQRMALKQLIGGWPRSANLEVGWLRIREGFGFPVWLLVPADSYTVLGPWPVGLDSGTRVALAWSDSGRVRTLEIFRHRNCEDNSQQRSSEDASRTRIRKRVSCFWDRVNAKHRTDWRLAQNCRGSRADFWTTMRQSFLTTLTHYVIWTHSFF